MAVTEVGAAARHVLHVFDIFLRERAADGCPCDGHDTLLSQIGNQTLRIAFGLEKLLIALTPAPEWNPQATRVREMMQRLRGALKGRSGEGSGRARGERFGKGVPKDASAGAVTAEVEQPMDLVPVEPFDGVVKATLGVAIGGWRGR